MMRAVRRGVALGASVFCGAALSACGGPGNDPAKAVRHPVTDATVVVQAAPVSRKLFAYAQVRPIVAGRVRTTEAGTVTAIRVLPGSIVRAGEVLARLGGPQIEALMVRKESAVNAARALVDSDRQLLDIERSRLALELSTRQAVARARGELAAANATLAAARADLRAANASRDLRAPAAGRVLSIDAGDGERVAAGQTVFTVESNRRLWVRAVYYGADARVIRVGMTGKFQPVARQPSIAVRVVAVAASLAADGGETVGLAEVAGTGAPARPAQPWIDGERGTVALDAGLRRMVAVPTDALVLDRARWYVLVATPGGLERREVVPGPARGWRTFIERGLNPGERIIAENAYLEFHRGIAARYTPPD